MYTFSKFRSQSDRASTRRPQVSRQPLVETLEGRQLLSTVAAIQGAPIGTTVAAISARPLPERRGRRRHRGQTLGLIVRSGTIVRIGRSEDVVGQLADRPGQDGLGLGAECC